MIALTTRQRDLLNELLANAGPVSAEDLASRLDLTARQVKYDLKGIHQWLIYHDILLEVVPGVGIKLEIAEQQKQKIQNDLNSINHLQLILSAEERQQLIALLLLANDQPKFLSELKEIAQVSRTTIIKDLDIIELWFDQQGLVVVRRPNYGIEVDGTENLRQKLITMLLWGESPFGQSCVQINYTEGLIFTYQSDTLLHPLLAQINQILKKWDMKRVFAQISFAEDELKSRLTDDASLHLALVFAIQTDRINLGHHLVIKEEHFESLKVLPVWDIAKYIAMKLGWQLRSPFRENDIAGIAIWLLSAPRSQKLPEGLGLENQYEDLIAEIMADISQFYNTPEMSDDLILRNGLINHIIPACLQQKFDLWYPFPYPNFALSEKYVNENEIAQKIVDLIERRTPYRMPLSEINNIAALLRAARIRFRPLLYRQILVVCPGGMASAQLLMSRLNARFPRMGPLRAISIRELSDQIIEASDLIITTVDLSEEIFQKITVVKVHPLLLAADVETITRLIT